MSSDVSLTSLDCMSRHEATEISRLHVAGLPDSINSMRGEKSVAWIYRYVLKKKQCVIVAAGAGRIAGVITATDSRRPPSTLTIAAVFPLRWVALLLGRPLQLIRLLSDAVSLAHARTRAGDHLYIAALVVEPSRHRSGIGLQLVMEVVQSAKRAGLKVLVDTHRDNEPARRLYEAAGFRQIYETKLSVMFVCV